MVSRISVLGVWLALVAASGVLGTEVAAQVTEPLPPDGLFTISPVLDRSCIAVRIPIAKSQALAGVKWFNNDGDLQFPKVLAASGYSNVPPLYDDGMLVAENVFGGEYGWGEVVFSEAIASMTNVLYVIFQFPANVEGDSVGVGPGFGYTMTDTPSSIFVSPDGDDWSRLAMDYQLMVEPVYTGREEAGVALSSRRPDSGQYWNRDQDREEESLPELVIEKTELLSPYPNPCNPSTTIAFTLRTASLVKLDVYDIRGRLVKSLLSEALEVGRHEVVWLGRDRRGSGVASGVYFARMQADGFEAIKRVLLVK